MFPKPYSELLIEDLEAYFSINSGNEGNSLELKQMTGANLEKDKFTVCKAVSAFANSGGGYLILGVTDNKQIEGVPKKLNDSTPFIDWINQTLAGNLKPEVVYFDPHPIELKSDESKLVVIIYVPESKKKPHQVSIDFKYYLRLNNQSKPAEHYQINNMFEISRVRKEEHNLFLRRKNLEDENSTDFGLNKNSERLQKFNGEFSRMILFSAIPINPNTIIFTDNLVLLNDLIREFIICLSPYENYRAFKCDSDFDVKLDGLIYNQRDGITLDKYLDVMVNGFVEIGSSSELIGNGQFMDNFDGQFVYGTRVVGQSIFFLHLIRNLYRYYKSNEDVNYQLSFVGMFNMKITQFHKELNINTLHTKPNRNDNNFKLNFYFKPRELGDNDINDISKIIAIKMSNAFSILYNNLLLDHELDKQYLGVFHK